MSDLSVQGTCLCKGVQFAIRGTPEKVFACYCNDCVSNSGSPYQICAKMPKENLSITHGTDLLANWVCTETASGYEKHKIFCKQCGCTLWTIPMHHKGETYVVRAALLQDGLATFKPSAEFFASRRPEYLAPIAGATSFDTMPGRQK